MSLVPLRGLQFLLALVVILIIDANYRVIVLVAVVTQSYPSLPAMVLMKSSHWFCSVSVYQDGPVINLRQSLQLQVVTPHPAHSLSLHIFIKVTVYKLFEEFSFAFYVIHASFPYQCVVSLIAAIYLVRDCPKETVSITLNRPDLQPSS